MIRGDRAEPRELEMYAGRDRLGTIIVTGRTYQAMDADGGSLGYYPDQRSAARAVVERAGPRPG
jgi:hypothetical protein